MKTKTKNEEIEKFKKLYGIKDTDIVLRLWGIKTKLKNEKNIITINSFD